MKILGKIEDIKLGHFYDHKLFGVIIHFSLDGGSTGIGCGGKYTINIAEHTDRCEWTEEDRNKAISNLFWTIQNWIEQAKVENFGELRGVPVEVEIEDVNGMALGGTFKGFRILTEVI